MLITSEMQCLPHEISLSMLMTF